jgi:hypothetical protein
MGIDFFGLLMYGKLRKRLLDIGQTLGKHPFVNFVFPEPLLDMPYTSVSAVRRLGW